MVRFPPLIILLALAVSIVVPTFTAVGQTSSSSTPPNSEPVCIEVERTFWENLLEGAVSVGEFLIVTVPMMVAETTLNVAVAAPKLILDTTVDTAEYTYTCVYIFSWWAGTPHPADIFPNSKTPRS